ncbi:MAG TPA: DNA polymerase III subunit delta' [Aquifex aeolicus]|nr:DNA polymerase III subunit delta' [Aquifex aeolicus]
MERVFLEKIFKLGRVPGGLLFYGKEGSGKTKTALDFSKGLLCQNKIAWGCGECPSCKYISEFTEKFFREEIEDLKVYEDKEGKKQFVYLMGEHPDFIMVIPHGNYIKIDQIRKVKEFAYIKPALSKRKVIVVDDAHAMTNQSANAILKVLEEPPPDTTFILTTNKRSAILPTIISRTFQVEFKGFSVLEIKKIAGVDDTLAKLSGGSLKKAILLKENRKLVEKVTNFLKNEPLEVFKIATEFEKWDTDKQRLFLDLLEHFLTEKALKDRENVEQYSSILDKIRIFKEGIPRGINGSLWLVHISSQLSS